MLTLKEFVELEEIIGLSEGAAKLGAQVKIHAPGKSYHEKVGHIGEIRHGLYKGAPKTYTVDYEGSEQGSRLSIQLDRKQFKLHEEQIDELSKQTLGSYIKKATGGLNGVGRHAFDSGNTLGKADGEDSPSAKSFAIARKRIKGVEKATDRLMKEEEDDIVSEAERTSAFVFTHKPGDAASEKKLADLKNYVKMHNALQKGTPKRVSLKGRLGKDNPNAGNYKGKAWGHQTIRKADAAHFDVYVHDRT